MRMRTALVEQGRETSWKAVSGIAATLAAMATHTALNAAWGGLRSEEPPLNPAAHDTRWREALLWAAAIGLTVGVAQLLARRSAAAGWRAYFGDYPKGF